MNIRYRFAVAPRTPGQVASGLTLVEMLVAMAASLILLGAVMAIFQQMGDAVTASRRLGRLEQQLDTVVTKLMLDLHGVTAATDDTGLTVASDIQNGYFEIVEGPSNDYLDYSTGDLFDRTSQTPGPTPGSDDRIVGDVDDMLFFTTVTVTPDLFSGKFGNQYDTSETAEVAYFCRPTPDTSNPRLYTLYRRQVLVRGLTPLPPFSSDGTYEPPPPGWAVPAQTWQNFLADYDVSVRRQNNPFSGRPDFLVLNGLDDLQRRQNRFAHDPVLNSDLASPPAIVPIAAANPVLALSGQRTGEDVLLTNVLAFDVRVLDQQVLDRRNSAVRLGPSDPGYWTGRSQEVRTPQYVDLGYGHSLGASSPDHSVFSRLGVAGNPLTPSTASQPRTFDTWSTLDGTPPYPDPLPTIQVTIRVYDAASRRVRQTTLSHPFSR